MSTFFWGKSQPVTHQFSPGTSFVYTIFMFEKFKEFDQFYLSELLLVKNKEFTDGMKKGKKSKELSGLYDEIKMIYQELKHRRFVRQPHFSEL